MIKANKIEIMDSNLLIHTQSKIFKIKVDSMQEINIVDKNYITNWFIQIPVICILVSLGFFSLFKLLANISGLMENSSRNLLVFLIPFSLFMFTILFLKDLVTKEKIMIIRMQPKNKVIHLKRIENISDLISQLNKYNMIK